VTRSHYFPAAPNARKRQARYTPGTGAVYWNANVLANELGRTGEAVHLADKAVALFGEGTDERNLARLHGTYGTLILRDNPARAEESLQLMRKAHEALLTVGSTVDIAYNETEMSRALSLLGDTAGSRSMTAITT